MSESAGALVVELGGPAGSVLAPWSLPNPTAKAVSAATTTLEAAAVATIRRRCRRRPTATADGDDGIRIDRHGWESGTVEEVGDLR